MRTAYESKEKGADREGASLLSLDEQIKLAGDLVVRARVFFDIWWLFSNQDERAVIGDIIGIFSQYTLFNTHANFVAFVVHISIIFDKRKNVIGLGHLLRKYRQERYDQATVYRVESLLREARPIVESVKILRDTLFAHRSNSMSYDEAFTRAAVTPDELAGLTDSALCAVNCLLRARGHRELVFNEYPLDSAKEMVHTLSMNLKG